MTHLQPKEKALFSSEWCERVIRSAVEGGRVSRTKKRLHMSAAVFREFMEMAFSNGHYTAEAGIQIGLERVMKQINHEKQVWRRGLRARCSRPVKLLKEK